MGGKASRIGQYASQAKDAAGIMKDSVTSVGTHATRKVKKQGLQFMAKERAEKAIDRQSTVPLRAPMNVSKLQMSEHDRKLKLEEVEKQQEKDENYVSLMKDVFVTSDNKGEFKTDEHADKLSKDNMDKLPQRGRVGNFRDVPLGCADLKTVIAALHNHRVNPADWGPSEIAEKVGIRESDAKDVLEYFGLIDDSGIATTKPRHSIRQVEPN